MSSTEKHNFWNKVKTSTKSITTSLGNLSLRTEHDGDSVQSTLIHKALVNYYTTQNRGYPDWLGHIPDTPQHNQQSQQPQQSLQYTRQQHLRPDLSKYRRHTEGTNLHQQPPSQGQLNQGQQPQIRTQHTTNSDAAQSQSQTNVPTARSTMKDRLKRNNYRSNFA